jgi:hypothetical protein
MARSGGTLGLDHSMAWHSINYGTTKNSTILIPVSSEYQHSTWRRIGIQRRWISRKGYIMMSIHVLNSKLIIIIKHKHKHKQLLRSIPDYHNPCIFSSINHLHYQPITSTRSKWLLFPWSSPLQVPSKSPVHLSQIIKNQRLTINSRVLPVLIAVGSISIVGGYVRSQLSNQSRTFDRYFSQYNTNKSESVRAKTFNGSVPDPRTSLFNVLGW